MAAARFTVVAVMKSDNPIMSLASAVRLDDLKFLMGYKEHETLCFSVVMEDLKRPDLVIEQANRLHNAFRPNVAGYTGIVSAHGQQQDDAFLIVMTTPDSEKGNGYLRVGENMWMYRRNTRTFQFMARDQTIAGTGATASDFERRKFTKLYEPALDDQNNEILSEKTLGKAKIPVYRFEVTAKVKDVKYPKVIYWVRQDNFLTIKQEEYSLSGTLMNTTYFPKWTTVEGNYIPLRMVFVDEFEKGNKTLVELSGISLRVIDNNVFTKAYLENLSK